MASKSGKTVHAMSRLHPAFAPHVKGTSRVDETSLIYENVPWLTLRYVDADLNAPTPDELGARGAAYCNASVTGAIARNIDLADAASTDANLHGVSVDGGSCPTRDLPATN